MKLVVALVHWLEKVYDDTSMHMKQSLCLYILLVTKSSAASTSKTVSEKTATITVEGSSAETSHQHQLCKLHIQYIDRLMILLFFIVSYSLLRSPTCCKGNKAVLKLEESRIGVGTRLPDT